MFSQVHGTIYLPSSFFDQQSGLLVRVLRFAETPLGRNPTEIDYADYRVQDGVKTPFRWTVARPNGSFIIQIAQMQQNVPIGEDKFVKPAPPPQSSRLQTKFSRPAL